MAGMESRIFDHPGYGPCVRLEQGSAEALIGLWGGQVLSWRCGADEQLYLSPQSRHGHGASVRGGIPVIFPQFADQGPGPRHGFARTSAWTLADDGDMPAAGTQRARLRLQDHAGTLAAWPHRFVLEQTITLRGSGLDIDLALRNTDDHAWSFSAALHSYWRIAPGRPVHLLDLAQAPFLDRSEDGRDSAGAGPLPITRELERLYRDAPTSVGLRDIRTLRLASTGWPDLMVWNPGPGKARALADLDPLGQERFLCVEPLLYAPLLLAPGAIWRAGHRVDRIPSGTASGC